uniref:Uncharacterized protein n=1 Tax=Panagrolaimus davidi TaxID=227884 RepID=A0A914QVH4_9BILA
MNHVTKNKFPEEVYPISLEWIVKRGNLDVSSAEVPIQNLEDVSFSLSLNPKSGKDEDQATINFRLKSSLDFDITVNAIISCQSAAFCHPWTNTFKKDDERKCQNIRLCFSDEFLDPASKFFVDNQMTIGLKGTLKVETGNNETEAKEFKPDILGHILWESEKDKDLVIYVGDEELKVGLCFDVL